MRGESRGTSSRGGAVAGTVSRRGNDSSSRGTASGSVIDRRVTRDRSEPRSAEVTARGDSRFDRGNGTETRTYDRSTRNDDGVIERTDRSRTTSPSADESYRSRSTDRNRNGGNGNGGNGTYRNGDRNGGDRNGGDRNGGNGTYRNGDRNGSYRNGGNGTYRNGNHGSYGNRQPYYGQGRISQVHRYGGGYRIWIVGSPYPFFIPEAYYRSSRFRIGLSIRLGGYYNPLGYYDYYDGYDDGYYSRGNSRGELRGTVESVDYRRDTFVIRNEATGSFVTVVLRDRREDVRTGDFVEVSGDWTRNGVFEAYDVDQLDYDRDYRR